MSASPANPALDNIVDDISVIRERAAQWVIALDVAESDQQRLELQSECDAWQAAHPQHRQVFEQMRQMVGALEESGSQKRRRHKHWSVLGMLLMGSVLLWQVLWQLPWQMWTADHRTTVAEIQKVTLPDGSRVVLNGNSAINVDFSDDQRIVHLERGELLVTVQHDEQGRPFRVETPEGSVVALGTVFSVKRLPDATDISVLESRVKVIPRDAQDNELILEAGQRARLTAMDTTSPRSVSTTTPSWVDRLLVFNDAPLPEVVNRLGQYRHGLLHMDDALSDRQLHFTGVLPLDDSDVALSLLAESMDLEVQQITPYVVWLKPAEKN